MHAAAEARFNWIDELQFTTNTLLVLVSLSAFAEYAADVPAAMSALTPYSTGWALVVYSGGLDARPEWRAAVATLCAVMSMVYWFVMNMPGGQQMIYGANPVRPLTDFVTHTVVPWHLVGRSLVAGDTQALRRTTHALGWILMPLLAMFPALGIEQYPFVRGMAGGVQAAFLTGLLVTTLWVHATLHVVGWHVTGWHHLQKAKKTKTTNTKTNK